MIELSKPSDGERFLSDGETGWLVEHGVPFAVAEIIQTHRGMSKSGYVIGLILFMIALIILMIGFALLPVSPFFQKLLVPSGLIAPDAILVNHPAFATVIGVFLGIMTTGVLFCLVTMANRGLAIRSAVTQFQQLMVQPGYQRLNRWMLRKIVQRINPMLPPGDYLGAFPRACLGFYLKFFVPIVLTFAVFTGFDIAAISYATEEKISLGRYFTLRRTEFTWDEVETISTGCHTEGSKPLKYNLHFPGGRVRDLEDFQPVRPETEKKLEVLSRIDEKLREHGVPWQPAVLTGGIYKGKSLHDQACFLEFRNRLSDEEWPAFVRLYRVNGDETKDG